MPLANTEYYEKNKLWYDVEGNAYWLISPFHDGNCGLHAFACGLIDMIITGKLSLDAEKFNAFKNTILESLTEDFNDNHSYINVLLPNFPIIKTLCKTDLTFNFFKVFLSLQAREGLAAANLILAPGLRVIGVTQYLSLINKQDNTLLEEDAKLLKDGEYVGEEVLSSLANYFGIPVRLILDRSSDPSNYYHDPLPKKDLPVVSLLNKEKSSHWHYLLPENQTDGLARMLPQRKKSKTSLQSNEQLQNNEQILQDIEKNYIKTTPIFNKETLSSLSEKLKQIFCHLKIIFSTISIGSRDALNTLRQANIAAKKSTKVLNTLRQTWDYDTNELDKRLNKLGLKKIEKDLIKRPIIMDNSKDAAMAAVLQNAKIADFFSRNYTTLTSLFTDVSTPPTLQGPNKANNTKLLSH